MKLDFRIDWGYQYLYSRRHYHPFYHWDGSLECSGGTIEKVFQLDYPVIWYGPGHCARETLLDSPRWKSTTRRGLAGIRVEAQVEKEGTFLLKTLSGTFEFTVADILEKGRIEFPVGPKYLGCHVIVTRTGYYHFQAKHGADVTVLEADDLLSEKVPVRDWARMRTAWLAPGESCSFKAVIPSRKKAFAETVLHLVGMASPEYTPGAERQVHDDFPMEVYCDGVLCGKFTHYFREHDTYMQLLEDAWCRFSVPEGEHIFTLKNCNRNYFLLINRLTLRQSELDHQELSLPRWALVGEEIVGRIFALYPDSVTVDWGEGSASLELKEGWNEFTFTLQKSGVDRVVRCGGSAGVIREVYALADEVPEVTVGFDMTTVPHDDNGFMDYVLDYTWRTRLGNLVVFRNFRRSSPEDHSPVMEVEDSLLSRWGAFFRDHHIYVEAATSFDSGALTESAGKMLHSVGRHEWPGAVYAFDPKEEWASEDMKSAMEHCMKRLKIEIDRAHKVCKRAAFGDASGGHRYCYLAGADFIRTETMVPHTQHLCSQARPCAEALSDGEWGVHIAIQHAFQPYYENHLGVYYLSLLQPWMMGANMIYEEDCLFHLFKEERQAWDDALTKGKRDMTRAFYKFVKTHPRKGRVTRKIAFVEGRYAAPFNGFICDVEQTPDYSVWGLFGKNDPLWGHKQPEKCRQVLDVLMPGANTMPLRQDYQKRRFFFSGTPYGDFDEIPTEASADYFKNYSLLFHLGWNTMIAEDHAKLCSFVEDGGTLLIGLPQFSCHVKRDFLADMKDLNLWNGGDLSELCGVKVKGCSSEVFSGQWNCADRPEFDWMIPDLSAIPSSHIDEDGPCRPAELDFAGAEPFIWDASTGKTLVSRFRKGKGMVYLMTTYAYPGHEALQKLSAALVAALASENLPQNFVCDPTGEVFWNEHVESDTVQRLMLLNTDWTTAGNIKSVTVHTPDLVFVTTVKERQAKIPTVLPGAVLECEDLSLHMEILSCGEKTASVRCNGKGRYTVLVRTKNEVCEKIVFGLGSDTQKLLDIALV
ncbi:MAG: hypothetical protein J6S58_00445 [Lentisphaeria bacterium]|nr:hypothetical protein [Lentisphaeria bacterium]